MPSKCNAVVQVPGEHTMPIVIVPGGVHAVLEDENQHNNVPVWLVLQKPDDTTTKLFTAAFLNDHHDNEDAMLEHIK